ncbi:MAG: subtilisin family serine protease [Bacteroidia bacterium]
MRIDHLTIKLVFLFLVLVSCEQKRKYWIYHDEIECYNSDETHSNPTCDEFSSKSKKENDFRNSMKAFGIGVESHSNWLNAGTSWLSKSELKKVANLSIVKEVIPVTNLKLASNQVSPKSSDFSFALEQIQGEYLIGKGLRGKGVKIGIIDGGFLYANEKNALAHVFKKKAVKGYKDYLAPNMKRYGGTKSANDGHGTEVWTQIAGLNSKRNVQFGLATEAEFYLARTDDGRKENRVEEEYLIKALEWLDSQGVKLVNISLGYSTGFDNPKDNYLPEHIDGKHTSATRAVNIASEEKGMLIIVSAGNDGQNSFKVLSVPGDAKGVLTVGATNFKTWDKTNYSSIGPEQLGFLKPNVSCFAFNGTSFSALVITGLAACIMQLNDSLTIYDVISIIERSCHLFPYGNNYVGYGVPSCKKVNQIVTKEDNTKDDQVKLIKSRKSRVRIKMPFEEGRAILFHKSSPTNVISQKKEGFTNFTQIVTKPKNALYAINPTVIDYDYS